MDIYTIAQFGTAGNISDYFVARGQYIGFDTDQGIVIIGEAFQRSLFANPFGDAGTSATIANNLYPEISTVSLTSTGSSRTAQLMYLMEALGADYAIAPVSLPNWSAIQESHTVAVADTWEPAATLATNIKVAIKPEFLNDLTAYYGPCLIQLQLKATTIPLAGATIGIRYTTVYGQVLEQTVTDNAATSGVDPTITIDWPSYTGTTTVNDINSLEIRCTNTGGITFDIIVERIIPLGITPAVATAIGS